MSLKQGVCNCGIRTYMVTHNKRLSKGSLKMAKFKEQIRQAIADYMATEGCSCCQDTDGHNEVKKKLAKMLNVPMYSDKSGYDFYKFKSK